MKRGFADKLSKQIYNLLKEWVVLRGDNTKLMCSVWRAQAQVKGEYTPELAKFLSDLSKGYYSKPGQVNRKKRLIQQEFKEVAKDKRVKDEEEKFVVEEVRNARHQLRLINDAP